MGKWLWRYAMEKESWWVSIIDEKYGYGESYWFPKIPTSPYGHSVWRDITNSLESFKEGLAFEVQSGRTVKFWSDNWTGGGSLMSRFPTTYAAASSKKDFVDEVAIQGRQQSWILGLHRRNNDVVIDEIAGLMDVLDRDPNLNEDDDVCRWLWNHDKIFSVASCYSKGMDGIGNFPTKLVWNRLLPCKISFFVWVACHARSLTLDQLQRRGWSLANRCFLCGAAVESGAHLFLHCSISWRVWAYFFAKFRVNWTISDSVIETLRGWNGYMMRGRAKVLWSLLPAAIMKNIWFTRNAIVFEDKTAKLEKLCSDIVVDLHLWSSVTEEMRNVHLDALMVNWDSIVFDPG